MINGVRLIIHGTGGHRPTAATVRNGERLKKLLEKDPNISMRTAAAKLSISKSTVQRIKANKFEMKTYKSQTVKNIAFEA